MTKHYVRYNVTDPIDNEIDNHSFAEIRMEDELHKLKTTNTDELESSLLEPQSAIGQQMSDDFRMRKLDAALADLHKRKESRPSLLVLTDADEIAMADVEDSRIAMTNSKFQSSLPQELDRGEEREFEAYEAMILKRAMTNSKQK